ncbi:MAG: HEAT repeat domain-containing protein [Acidimicrobiales bacterium]
MTGREFEPSATVPADPSGPQRIARAELRGDLSSLRDLAVDRDPSIRALSLGALDRLEALDEPHLTRSLGDTDPRVRNRAVVLAMHRPAIDLVSMLADSSDLVVESAAWALGERGDSSDAVVDALRSTATVHEISICREAAVAALGAIGAERGLDAILAGLNDRAPVRRRAVLALAPFEGPLVEHALDRALEDRDRQVRQAAEDLR